MNVSITPELEAFIQAKVKGGMYNSASELIREALRLLAERDELRKKRIEKLNQEIQIGVDQVARGELVSGEEVEAELDKMFTEFDRSNGQKI